MKTKLEWVWIGKSHSFKKAFWKLSLQFIMSQKYLDKLYSKCCKIFKAYLTSKLCSYPFECSYFLKLSLWCRSLSNKSSIDLQKKINKTCLYVIVICVSHCAIELDWIWFLWIGIWNLCYVKKETLFQTFSHKLCEFLHNDAFWDFVGIILQIFGWLLLDSLLLNRLFVNVIKIINLTILKVNLLNSQGSLF